MPFGKNGVEKKKNLRTKPEKDNWNLQNSERRGLRNGQRHILKTTMQQKLALLTSDYFSRKGILLVTSCEPKVRDRIWFTKVHAHMRVRPHGLDPAWSSFITTSLIHIPTEPRSHALLPNAGPGTQPRAASGRRQVVHVLRSF